jgi:integrative and conjugative element protein (TIGR02256 family)
VTSWNGWTPDGAYGLRIEAGAFGELDRICREAGLVETGGILVGCYSHDLTMAIVHEVTPPPSDSRRGHTWFNRGVAGLRDMLAQRWRARDRTHYLGEWHFHPASIIVPSTEDFSQMITISKADEYKCREPLLVILGSSEREGARALRVFICPAGGSPTEVLPMKMRPI